MTTTPKRSDGVKKSLTLSDIAELVQGEVVGDKRLVITGVAGLREAEKGDISFLANAKYLPFLRQTQASAIIAPVDVQVDGLSMVRTDNPSRAFTRIVEHFMPPAISPTPGLHPSAIVDPSAVVDASASVGPRAVVAEHCHIGKGAVIGAGCVLAARCQIGEATRLYPNVTLREGVRLGRGVIIHSGAVIGSDGFGYETIEGKHMKIPQLGSVEIGDDVEIGSCVCVDRGRFQDTRIGRGTKIDNLVQIAHNVVIGEDCLIVSQAGISGSTTLEDRVIVAGQAGLVGHITIGADCIIGARSGVSKSVPAGTVVLGEPARPIQEQKRLFALIGRLPELFKEFAELKKKNT